MADPPQANPAPAAPPGGELDARVTALLDEMHQASDRMIRHLDGGVPSDALDQPEATMPVGAADELGKAVDQMIADAKAAGRPPGPLAALDEEISHRAGELIEGEIADEAQVLAAADVPGPAPAPPMAPLPVTAAVRPPTPGPPRPAAAPAVPAPVTEPLVAKNVGPADAAAPPMSGPVREAGVLHWLLARLAKASAPLSRRPHLRPWVGYLAIWTLFNAGCLLGYNFFVREPEPPKPPPAKAVSHGKSDGHAEKTKQDGHGASKADADGDAGSHGTTDGQGKTAKATPKRTRSALPKKKNAGGH